MIKNSPWFDSYVFCISKNLTLINKNLYKINVSSKTEKNQQIFFLPHNNGFVSLNYNFFKQSEEKTRIKKNIKIFALKTNWVFWKFKYNGKGLKIKKSNKNKQILFNLGASHVSKIKFNPKKLNILRTKKNTFTILSNVFIQKNLIHFFCKIRTYNKYTKRGLRLSRQPMPRRFGKVSQLGNKKR